MLEYIYSVSDHNGMLDTDHSYVLLFDALSVVVDVYGEDEDILRLVKGNASWGPEVEDFYKSKFYASICRLKERSSDPNVLSICDEILE